MAGTEDQRKLHVIHNERKKLHCVFNTLVIRNEALERLYEGGLIGFLDKHGGECNGKITVVCYMWPDIDETMDELVENGLVFTEDFEFIDAGIYLLCDLSREAYPPNIKQRVDWLKGMSMFGILIINRMRLVIGKNIKKFCVQDYAYMPSSYTGSLGGLKRSPPYTTINRLS